MRLTNGIRPQTYGVPTISRLLAHTAELLNDETAGKRAADTRILIVETVQNPVISERRLRALARINYLHAPYRRTGKILEDDMLYTLSLFALEPVRWARRFEWRPLTPLEMCATGAVWRTIGTAMDISYDALEPYMSKEYDDGITWIEAMEKWSLEYETENLVPAESNGKVAKATMNILLAPIPKFLHPVAVRFNKAVMDSRLRRAVM